MKYTVCFPNFKKDPQESNYRFWFDLNNTPYEWVSDDHNTPVDFLLAIGKYPPCRISVSLSVWHSWENKHSNLLRLLSSSPSNTVIISESFDTKISHEKIITQDFMFNRTKAYYSQFPPRPNSTRWYYHSSLAFNLPPLDPNKRKNKTFISPTQLRTHLYRKKIVDLLIPYQHKGYLSYYDLDNNHFLYPHLEFPFDSDFSIEDLESTQRPLSYNYWGYSPPHNLYYQNSFISIYGETIEWGTTTFVSEKTYDPLIKGHFILPFSNQYFVRHLLQIGILLPDFIDYSYDSIEDADHRFAAWSDEARRLISLDLDTWHQHYADNIELLYCNQKYFYDRDYDRIDLAQILERFG